MKLSVLVYFALWLWPSILLAADCSRAVSHVDEAVCGNPELVRLDERLNYLYGDLQPQLTVGAQGALRTQQRAWITKRDRLCEPAEGECLRKLYVARIDDLSLLEAESRVTKDKLSSLTTPSPVQGTWKATEIKDPVASKPASVADTQESLARADLPGIGKRVSATPGRACVEGQDCRFIAWKRSVLGKVQYASALERVLGMAGTAPVLVGETGASEVPGLLLLPRTDGAVLAVFSLRKPEIQDSNYAVEVWVAATGYSGDVTKP